MKGDRERQGRWVFGVHPVIEVLRARPEQVGEVLLARRAAGRGQEIERLARSAHIRVRHVTRRELDDLAEGLLHQGAAVSLSAGAGVAEAVCPDPGDHVELLRAAERSGEEPLLLALDGIQDPRNLGALVRSAHALGAHGVIAPRDRAAGMTPAAVKTSAGAAAHLPVLRVTNLARTLDDLKRAGLWVVGAEAAEESGQDGKAAPAQGPLTSELGRADLSGPIVLVVGAEGAGLRRLVRERCDRLIHIPMVGRIGSLNASVAGGILLYEVRRQRRAASSVSSG
ncbi:MAG: 23S rRNA (guanosine(2251)-2'-O)-methyltransferase RlmB [Myxococcota bacterium]